MATAQNGACQASPSLNVSTSTRFKSVSGIAEVFRELLVPYAETLARQLEVSQPAAVGFLAVSEQAPAFF